MRKFKYSALIFLLTVACVCMTLAGCDLLGHEHTYPTAYETDETHHWRVCSTCNQATDKVEHVFGNWKVDPSQDQRYRQCRVCSYIEYDSSSSGDECQHDISSDWKKDATNHYKQCSKCLEKFQVTLHSFGGWVVDKEPTETQAGSKYTTCSECQYVKRESIDPTGNGHKHSYSDVYDEVDSSQHSQQCSCGFIKYSDHELSTQYVKSDNTLHYRECSLCKYKSYSAHSMTQWTTDRQATATQSGHKYRDCLYNCGHREEATIPQLTQASGSVDFYAINDFHGEHERLAQIAGYMSYHLKQGNTVAINSGDMFQGSMESNSNYGSLFIKCMDMAGFDAFVYGNHEFDWGLDNLRTLARNSATPFLGANIYNWNANTKRFGDFAEDLAQQYVIKDLDNGLRVGIIGVIGMDQITSISSQLVQTIGFKDPKEVVPSLSNKLKTELGCDIVVISAHTGQDTFLSDNSWDITQYADAVFCAHTHQAEVNYINGVPFIQGGSYGNNVSHVKLTVDEQGNVNCNIYENIRYNSLSGVDNNLKELVQATIDNSNARIAEEATEVLATLSGGSLDYQEGVARLVSHAIATYATSQGYSIELAMVNKARSDLDAGNINYTKLYEAIPFDNVVYIAKVSGADLLKEASYPDQSIWRVTGNAIENSSSKYYTIAVIDYLLYHQNTNRSYNYFPSAFTSGFTPVALKKAGVDMYNYRFITRDFLRAQGSIVASTYTVANDYTNKDKLDEQVDLGGGGGTVTPPTEPTHAGTLTDPYSVTDALLVAANYTEKNSQSAGYIKGKVANIANAKLASSSGDLYNFYLVDDSGNRILIYYVSKFNGATSSEGTNWASTSELKNGDEIVMYARYIFTYNSTTPETNNGYVVTINGVETK